VGYRIELHPGAVDDFDSLDGSVQKEVAKKIDALSKNPFLGKPLGHRIGIDLTGFYKLYAGRMKYRIVYRILTDYPDVIEIVGIGKREKEQVYEIVAKRLKTS